MIKKFDKNLIEEYVSKGWLRRNWKEMWDCRKIQILDYTQNTTFEHKWDEITCSCRGIVLDEEYNVIMPCMQKFFNFEQLDNYEQFYVRNLQKGEYILTQKYDGCLGSIFPYNQDLVVTSKCTFDNFVTDEIKDLMKDHIFVNDLEDTSTGLVVEVISPKTRQIVNYGNKRELRVITSFNLYTMEENDYEKTKMLCEKYFHLPIVEKIEFNDIDDIIQWQKTHDATEEGFVLREVGTNNRVKFKAEAYLNAARLVTYVGYTAFIKAIVKECDNHKDDKTNWWLDYMDDLIKQLPDELQKDAFEDRCKVDLAYEYWYDKAFHAYKWADPMSNKELGLFDNDQINPYKKIIFKMRKGQNYQKDIWNMVDKEDTEKRMGRNIKGDA